MKSVLVGFALLASLTACGPVGWGKSAGDTSCAEWLDLMTPVDQIRMARIELHDPQATDRLATLFAQAITRSCRVFPNESVGRVAGNVMVGVDPKCPWYNPC